MAWSLDGKVATAPVSEYGKTEVDIDRSGRLFGDVSSKTVAWMSHTDYIAEAACRLQDHGQHSGMSGSCHGK
jgi:GMP synthase (glutamine-hydrolysing)